MDEEVPERIPMVRVHISEGKMVRKHHRQLLGDKNSDSHILHTTPQAWLDGVRIPPENVHN